VERATNSTFTTGLTLLTTTAANSTSYTDSTAVANTTYYYRVRATNGAGDSGNSNTASVTTPSLPAAPSSLSGNATSATTVALTWTDNSGNETGFKVERATNSTFTTGLTLLTTTAANSTSYTDSTAVASTTYYYRVRATNAYGDSGNSNTVPVTTPAASIGIFSAATNIGGATPAGSGAFNSGTSVYTVVGGGADIWGTSDQFEFVSADKSGDFTLTARVASVQNTNSWAKAGVMIRDGVAANAIQAMVAITPGNGVAFQWRSTTGGASSTAGVAGVVAPQYVRITRTGSSIKAEYSANGTTWTQVGTTQTISFPTAVKAGLAVTSHTQGTGCTSTFDNVAFATTGAPAAPTGLGATSLYPTRVSLTWTDNSSNETGFKVERASDSGFTTGLTLLTTTAANATTYDDNTVSGSTTYYYRVRATNASGDSANSNSATLTTPAPQSTLAEDTFNGAAGALHGVSSGTGWSGAWNVQNSDTNSYTLATSPALSYSTLNVGSGLARGGGSYLSSGRSINTTAFTGYTRDASNNITGQSAAGSGVIYFSVLLRNDSNTTADIVAGLNNAGVSWNSGANVAIEVGQFGGVKQWGIRNSAGTVSRSSVAVTQGATALLVVKVDWTNNLASLFVNPTQLAAAEPTTASATVAIPSMFFRNFHFYGGNSVNDSSLGAIRLGARYLDVTPTQSGQIQGMSVVRAPSNFSATPVQGSNAGGGGGNVLVKRRTDDIGSTFLKRLLVTGSATLA
jgi:regulation of enolase protein 1 (concanavalin A-like superfamily)